MKSFFSPKNVVFLGITPDDRIVGRSLLYGGKAHEVADIVNKGTWAQAIRGTLCRRKNFLFHFFLCVLQQWATCRKEALKMWS